MASENPRKRLKEEVTCPVCLEYFSNPVTLTCEHSLCHACILYSPTSALCPVCKRDFPIGDMKLNYSLADFVEISKLLNDQEEADRYETCERHQEPQNLFCRDDQVLICTSCKEEHCGHNTIPVDEAAEEYKGHISDSLEALKKCKEELVASIAATQAESSDLFEQMEAERQKTAVNFRDLWPFLKSEEERMLARMKKTEEEMHKKKTRNFRQLEKPVCLMEDLAREAEDKLELPASQLLQDTESIVKRCEQEVKYLNPFRIVQLLKRKDYKFADGNSTLERALKKLKGDVAIDFQDAAGFCQSFQGKR
ncbi:zinc finger protein RFP-like [Paroedura picta]|uniref:zinc finger protein RFP-like n=1 Tax=Paroedura picta TaxID=143630 RepID=UPI004057915A